MGQDLQDDAFLSHSAKDKAVVRPLAERLRTCRAGAAGRRRKDALKHLRFPLQTLAFSLQPFPIAPIKGSLAQFLYINWRPANGGESNS
jgi:hypothetical protein